MKNILIIIIICISVLKLSAQNQCGTDEYNAFLRRTNPTYAKEQQRMEQHLYSIIKNKQNNPNARNTLNDCQLESVFTIPVVVHVIHKGEAIGTGTNISDAQIREAIDGMNERWRRVTGDGADMEIQFALAVRDTNDNITNGITRFDGRVFPNYSAEGVYSGSALGASDVSIMDSTDWDRSKYINIWVVDLKDACGYSTLGLAYTLFMSFDCMNYNSETLAHEMGHTFGLHHTFAGDGSGGGLDPSTQCPLNNDCLLDGDWVCDTPPHKKAECSSTSCTASGDLQNSFKNYMSYCGIKTRFTIGQKERTRNILNVEHFSNLVLSDRLIPISTPLEVGIVSIENNISEPVCTESFVPKIKIRNTGTNTLTNLKIAAYIDDILINTTNINTNLQTNNTTVYNLNPINFTSSGTYNLKIVLSEINGSTSDYQSLNNQICKDIIVRNHPENTICLNFEDGNIDTLLFISPLGNYSLSTVSGCTTIGSKVLKYDNSIASYSYNYNEYYKMNSFYLPSLNLDSVYSAYLTFDRAYKQGAKSSNLNLRFDVIDGCDSSAKEYIYYGYNEKLASVSDRDSVNIWTPTNCTQWIKDSVNLTRFQGKQNILIRGLLSNLGEVGNQPLYLDNFCIQKRYRVNITTTPDNAGYLSYSTGYGVYNSGDTVSVIASSYGCFMFKNWTENGVVVSTNNMYNITIDRNRNLVANFERIYTNVNLSVYPENAGTTMGGGLYPCDTTIIVKGISNEGYTFVNWTDSLGRIISTDSIYSVNIFDNNINLIANFKRINTFDVKLTARPIIGGSVFGSGQFKKDTIITITAIPNFGYAFNGWLDISWILEIGVSNAPNYTFQVTKDINLVADFVLGNKLTLNLNYPNGGIVTGSGYYAPNNYAEVRATANDCYNFLNWTENGNIYSTNSTEWIRMSTDRTLVANFVPKRYNISLSAYPTSGGSVVGSGNFPCDSLVFVRANPKTGYKFINWTENGNIVSTDSSYSFIVKKQRSLNANFSLITDIKQTEINKIVNVYPNPVRHILQVDLLSLQSSKITLNIIDINGNVLLTKTLFNAKGEINTSFDVSKLAKGNYILNLFDEDGMANYRFVVQ